MSKYGGNNRIDFGVHFNTDKSSLEQVKKSLQEIQNIKPGNFAGPERELRQIQKLAKEVQSALQNAFNVKLNAINVNQFKNSLQNMGHDLDSLYSELSRIGPVGKSAFNQVATSLTTTNTQLRESQGLLHSMGQTMMNTVKWGVASRVMNSFTQSVSEAFQYVKSLDSALTDIRIVTGDSTEQMAKFADQANRAAQELGRSTMDYSKAALTFYQQGLSDEDVAARTEATLKAQNITGAGQEMADYLTAVWNGYKVANEEAELYVDKLAAVADSSASNMSQLAIAMSKVASTANLLGVPVDSLNAQIATIVATTRQAPESVGNALKTIYARINDIKTGSDDAEVSLGNYTKQMAQLGINVLDASGNLRDTGDVIEQIGGKWENLSREQQIYLARTMAGQRQYNNLLALFENWSKYTDLVNVSMDSQGTTMQKNSRYMDSLAAHMEQLGAAGERVKSAMIDSDSFKGLIDIGTNLTNLFANFIEAIGGGGTALLALGSIVTKVFSGIISREIGNAIIQARENKAVYQEMLEKITLVQQQKQSIAYKDPNNAAYREYIDNLGIIHQSWQVLSQDERNLQQDRVKEIETLSEQKQKLQDNINLAEQFANAFKKSGYSTVSSKHLADGIEEISVKLSEARVGLEIFDEAIDAQDFNIDNLSLFKKEIEGIIEKIGSTPASDNLTKVLDQIEKEGLEDVEVINELHSKWIAFEQQTNKTMSIAPNLDKAKQDLDDYDNKIKTTSTDFKRLNDNAVTLNKVESFTKLTGGIAGFTSGLMSAVNSVKALKNESLPLGQRILQFISGSLFSLGMIVSSVKRIKDATVGILGPLTAQVIQEKLITKQKQRQAILDKIKSTGVSTRTDAQALKTLNTEINRLKSGGLSTLKESFEGIGQTANKAFLGIIDFLGSTAGLITVVTAAAVAMGYSFYRAYTETERSAKKAADEANNAKQQYSKVKDQLNNLKSGFDSLHSAQDNLANLTKGSLEWKQALEEVNGQVLELCQQFPKLNQYLYTTEDGLLAFKEGAEEDLFDFQHKQVQIAGNTYVAQQTKATQLANQTDIIEASRKWGLGNLNTSNLEDLIESMQKSGTQILDSKKALEELGFSSKDVARIQGQLKDKIISLNAEISSSTTALDNLQESVTRTNLEGLSEYQNSQNKDAFVKIAAAQQSNATLDDKYYKKYGVSKEINEDRVDKNALLQRYSEITGIEEEDLRIRKKTLQVRQENGEWEKTLSLQNLKQTIAQADIAEDANKNYQKIASKMSETAVLFNQNETTLQGAYEILANVDSLKKKDFSAIDISQFSGQSIKDIENNIDEFAKISGLTQGELKGALNEAKNHFRKNFNDFIDSLSPSVQNAFKELGVNSDNYSLEAAKALEEILMKGFQVEGKSGVDFMSKFLEGMDPSKIPDFNSFINSLNPTSLTLDSLKESFKEAGFNISATDEQLITFISYLQKTKEAAQTPQEAYKTIHQVGDGLKRNDQIQGEDKEKLEAAGVNVEAFFEETLAGTYKLKVSAKEWQEYINNISLEPAKEKIKEFQDQINGLSTFNETSKYAYKEGQDNETVWQNFIGEGTAGNNSQTKNRGQNPLLGQQLDFIKGLNDLTAEQEIFINKVTDAYKNQGTVTKEEGEQIKEILLAHKGVWQDIPGTIEIAQKAIDDYNRKIAEVQDSLDEDVEEQQWEILAEYLNENADKIEELDEDVKTFKEDAEDLAEAMLRYDSALESVNENYEDWQRALSQGAVQDQVQAGEQLKNVYSDLLDLPFESLSSDFTQDINNLELLKQAANGSEEAYDQLRLKAMDDIVGRVGLDITDFTNQSGRFYEQYNALQNGLEDLKIGAYIDDANLYDQMNQIINASAKTAQEATDLLATMGIDAEVEQAEIDEDQVANWIDAVPNVTYQSVPTPEIVSVGGLGGLFDSAINTIRGGSVQVPTISYSGEEHPQHAKGKKQVTAFRVKSAKKSSGGGFKFKNSSYGGGNKGSSGKSGGGGKKGGGSSSKPSIAKTNTTKIDTKKKTQENDPYYKVNKSLDKQSTLLKKLQDQEKNLSGKDRLKNLEAQAKNLKQQNELLEQRNRISNNVAAENSTANLRKRLQDAFGKNVSFDSEGKIADLNQTERAAVDSYNKAAQQAQSTFESVQKQYNNWILHTWNANSKAWQEAHQSEKEKWDERIKNAETNAKDAISAAEEEYKKKTDLIKAYEKALQEDQKRYEQYMNNIRKIMESTFEQRKIKIQFDLDSGELDRDWQDFENKVIRRIKDSDIVGNTAAQFRELSSYIQSQELQSVSDEIKAISDDIARVNAGAWTQLMGISQTDYEMLKPEDQQLVRKEALGMLEEQLKDLVKQEQDALSAIQDLTDEIAESYLDSIDAAKDALDEHIDQYERINDLIEHNVKLTELLYGDKGYDTLNKYYDLQKQNNMNTLQTLKQQEEYWRSRMQNEVVGSEAWKKFKENLDDAVDAVNSKLEDMLDNLTTQFEKKLAAAVERVNNKLTSGLGTSYLDEQWDYLNNYDDYFLDTYNATTGIEDVTRAYQQALDDAAANPKQQQRLNKLMNDQLKILREKDHLTEYDLERAKSMLEVEKARMALEDARNNKTKMRLRRDSQGNYTYQYVADEEKLGDLQQALADAQNDLYNQDKEHYKENLNTLYDTYKEYLEKMQELTEEYRQAQAEAEATGNDTWLKQVQARIDLAKEQYDKFYTGLLEDNEYNQTYVTQAFANGLNLDLSGLSSEEAWGVIQENVPWAASNIQNLANSISNLGGLLPATNSLLQDFSSAAAQYKADMNDILEAGGTSIQTIGQVINEEGGPLDTNIIEANSQVIMGYLDEITQKALTDVNTMQDLTQKLDEYWQNLNNNIQTYINNTREGYNTLQELLDSSTRAEVLDYIVPQTNTTSTEGLTQAKEQLSLENISGEDINTLYNNYLSYLQNTNGALEVPRSQAQYQQLAENQQQLQEQYDRFYTDLVQDMIQQISSMSIDSQIDQITAGTSQLLSNLIKNQSLLDQNVHIDANFPNVNNHTQIEEAFNNLVNMAAMRASGYRD